MEFKDMPVNDEAEPQFEIVLEHRLEREVIVAALSDLAISIMAGECATMNRDAANRVIGYLRSDVDTQYHQVVTHRDALNFARLIQHGAVSLPDPKQALADSMAKSIEQETARRIIDNMIAEIDDARPEDFQD